MARRFKDDEPIECDACGELIYAGSTFQVYRKDGKTYHCCSYEDCQMKILLEIYGDEFEEHELLTAYDHELIWGDMECDRMRDEKYE